LARSTAHDHRLLCREPITNNHRASEGGEMAAGFQVNSITNQKQFLPNLDVTWLWQARKIKEIYYTHICSVFLSLILNFILLLICIIFPNLNFFSSFLSLSMFLPFSFSLS
jgi:hypothetical protein